MKKILCSLFLSLLPLKSLAFIEINTFEPFDLYVLNNINNKGIFAFKGVWTSPHRATLEEVYCHLNTQLCTSSLSEIWILGASTIPRVDTNLIYYDVIDNNKNLYKLYSKTTGYTIEIDLLNKTATKYKVFNNGDVSKYNLIVDKNMVREYWKSLCFPDVIYSKYPSINTDNSHHL